MSSIAPAACEVRSPISLNRSSIPADGDRPSSSNTMDNLAELSTLPTTVLGKTDVPFYANTQMIIQKMML